MRPLEQFFSELKISKIADLDQVLRFLIKARLRMSHKRKQKLHGHFGGKPPIDLIQIDRLTPPRRMWRKFRPSREKRNTLSHSTIQFTTLKFALLTGMNKPLSKRPTWAKRLYDALISLDKRFREGQTIEHPRLITVEKSAQAPRISPKSRRGRLAEARLFKSGYRIVSVQDNLIDRMLHSLVAKYLSRRFSPFLSQHVYGTKKSATGSLAIQHLVEFRRKHGNRILWSAEVDIRNFFDSVPAVKVQEALQHFSERAACESAGPVNPLALSVMKSYLQIYCYGKAEQALMDKHGFLPGMDLQLKKVLDEQHGPFAYGTPQGSAFSTIVANLVLTKVDEKVEEILGSHSEPGYYARFVDDVVMVHTDPDVSQKLYETYTASLEEEGLHFHPSGNKPITSVQDYLGRKTLRPHPWCHPDDHANGHRWVAFLGYHIREDGEIRLRKATFEKEIQQQRSLINEIIGWINDPKTLRKILEGYGTLSRDRYQYYLAYRAELRLVARTVGLDRLRLFPGSETTKCWNSAFPHLNANSLGARQLKALDRHRCKQLSRLRKEIIKVNQKLEDKEIQFEGLEDKRLQTEWPDSRVTKTAYFGHPYSYFSLLAENPIDLHADHSPGATPGRPPAEAEFGTRSYG